MLPHQPPRAHLLPARATEVVSDHAPPLARRMLSWTYEGVLLFGVVFISGYLFSALTQARHALAQRHGLQAFEFAILGIYFGWLWSRGQTLAMRTWGIRVVDGAGKSPTQLRALWRYLLSWLWFAPPLATSALWQLPATTTVALMAIWVVLWAASSRLHPDRQFWHDALAGTRLIDVRPRGR